METPGKIQLKFKPGSSKEKQQPVHESGKKGPYPERRQGCRMSHT